MYSDISRKYQMKLVDQVEEAIWEEFKSYAKVRHYISKWFDEEAARYNQSNIYIIEKEDGNINLFETLHTAEGETLMKIAIDIGVETPDFIPSIPTFRNELKTSYETAFATFERAFKQVEEHPSSAVGLANSALESIIKEILKDDCIKTKLKGGETLYKLVSKILKEFQMFPNADLPKEIRNIGSSLMNISQNIEGIRSGKTEFHGKTKEDYIIQDPLYAYFIVNSVTTVGLFLNSYYKNKFPGVEDILEDEEDRLPF